MSFKKPDPILKALDFQRSKLRDKKLLLVYINTNQSLILKQNRMEIPKVKLVPQPETEQAKQIIGYEWNDIAGTRHFLGGKPDDLQESEYPVCDNCRNPMAFYAQIDSIGDRYDLVDCMVIHNFVCFDCFTVKAVLTQTSA